MKITLACASGIALFSLLCCAAEEDPSYEPLTRTRPAPPPKRAVTNPLNNLQGDPTPAPKAETKTPRNESAPVVSTSPAYSEPTPVVPATPSGPKVKYILDGKPVYEGDPDPVAESEQRAKEAAKNSKNTAKNSNNGNNSKPSSYYEKSPLIIRESTPPAQPEPRNAYNSNPPARYDPPRNAYNSAPTSNVNVTVPALATQRSTAPVNGVRLDFASNQPPQTVVTTQPRTSVPSSERKVKYILDGRPVYEGDPDPAPGSLRNSTYSPAATNTAQNSAIDDVTADKPVTGARNTEARGQLVLEEMTAPGVINSKAKRCYERLALIKKQVEAISRFMENRGKSNADLIHASEELLDSISAMSEIWPKSTGFLDVCSNAKRAALIYNNELTQVPWTWTRVRWSFDSMVKEVISLRSYGKTMADAETPPVPLRGKNGQIVYDKNGQIVYQDVPEVVVDPQTARREAMLKMTKEEIQRINRVNAEREAKRNELKTEIDNEK